MTNQLRIATVAALTLTCTPLFAQQQFGPSPQSLYKSHPGSAPTYVAYGAPTTATQITSMQGHTQPVASRTTKPHTATQTKRTTGRSSSGSR